MKFLIAAAAALHMGRFAYEKKTPQPWCNECNTDDGGACRPAMKEVNDLSETTARFICEP